MVMVPPGLADYLQRVDAVLEDQVLLDRVWRVEADRSLPRVIPEDVVEFLRRRVGSVGQRGLAEDGTARGGADSIWRAYGGNVRCRALARTTSASRRSMASTCERCRRKRAATARGFLSICLLICAFRIPHRLLLALELGWAETPCGLGIVML
jgi:hypothetical protein